MTGEERNRIINEGYADFIINYRNNPTILEGLQNATIHIMDEIYAVIYVPVSQLTGRSLGRLRIAIAPNLLGLASEASLEASGVDRLRNMPNFNLRGNGVLIGIVDTGINYMLPAFIKSDGTTKILSIWDQFIQSESSFPFGTNYGTEYSADQINQALGATNPMEIVPSTDENGHGTMLAGIAAGTDSSKDNFFSIAPEADLVIVKLKQAKQYLRKFYAIPDNVICYQENDVMWGVQYCFLTAKKLRRPIALCIGIGTSQSSHDGSIPIAQRLSMLADTPGIGIVTAIGNEGNKGRHFRGIIDPSIGHTTAELNVGEADKGFSMQLWGDTPGIYSIDILSPSGEYIPKIAASLQVNRDVAFIFEETTIHIEYQTVESQTGDQLILLTFRNTTPGVWKFTVYGQGDLAGLFHIWLPMGDFISDQTFFIQPDIYTTVLSPGAAVVPISVTAYNPINGTLFINASRGYSRSYAVKPELAAPGVNYVAPNLTGGYTTFTGTGVAAAHTTGIVALALEWGIVRGNFPNMDTLEIKKFLIRGAKRSANLTYPNRDWGYGMLDIFNVFDVLRGGG